MIRYEDLTPSQQESLPTITILFGAEWRQDSDTWCWCVIPGLGHGGSFSRNKAAFRALKRSGLLNQMFPGIDQ